VNACRPVDENRHGQLGEVVNHHVMETIHHAR
jgi:hypothetical protein